MESGTTRLTPTSQGLQCTPREFLLQIRIALIARDQLAQYLAYAPMAAGEVDHAFGERRAPEVSVKLSPHLRSALQFTAKVLPPELFIVQRRAGEISISE